MSDGDMRTPTLTPTLERLENRIVLDTAAVPALLGSTTVNIYDTLQADSDIAPLAWESNLTLPDGVTHGRTPEAGADLRNAVLSPEDRKSVV